MKRSPWRWIMLVAVLGVLGLLRMTGFHASARCRDGSYSWSSHRAGTCSGHGGVADWYR